MPASKTCPTCSKPSVSAEADLDIAPQVTQFVIPRDTIDLGLGDPPLSLLPLDLIREAARDSLTIRDSTILQYGAMQGDGYFLQSLAKFLSEKYLALVRPEELFTTCGASMGLHLICSLMTRPGDVVFVEEPTYFFALRILADHGLRLVPIQTDEAGLVVESLEEALRHDLPRFIYIIPTFQNPTGRTLPAQRRQRLLEISHKYGFLIVADEVYHLLSYQGSPPAPFAAFAAQGNVISLGSFSKILAPGLRLGWLHAGEKIINRLTESGLINSGGGMNPFTSAIIYTLIESGGLSRNIDRLVVAYRERMDAMNAALRSSMPSFQYDLPKGGFFIWVRLPPDLPVSTLLTRAETLKVGFRPGSLFSSQGGLQDHLRLCFAFYPPADLQEGIARLKRAL